MLLLGPAADLFRLLAKVTRATSARPLERRLIALVLLLNSWAERVRLRALDLLHFRVRHCVVTLRH